MIVGESVGREILGIVLALDRVGWRPRSQIGDLVEQPVEDRVTALPWPMTCNAIYDRLHSEWRRP